MDHIGFHLRVNFHAKTEMRPNLQEVYTYSAGNSGRAV
jgi:hypothetical protein